MFFILFSFSCLHSRPISYPGGWTFIQMNNTNTHSLNLHYTVSKNYSLGYRSEYWREKEWQFHGTQLNYLLMRLNNKKSQANLYFKSGFGLAISNYKKLDNTPQTNFFSGISIDWENRRNFFSYENRFNYNKEIDTFYIHKARVGLAPYIGSYGDLHSWLMLQVENMPKMRKKIVYTPFIRFFKGDYLAEVGLSNFTDVMLNFVKRY